MSYFLNFDLSNNIIIYIHTYICFSFVTGFSILEATNIAEQNVGVSATRGRCANDKAYKLNERAILSIETSQIFPELQQFPLDFSILAEIRTDQGLESIIIELT